jgi:hypothetical protein
MEGKARTNEQMLRRTSTVLVGTTPEHVHFLIAILQMLVTMLHR